MNRTKHYNYIDERLHTLAHRITTNTKQKIESSLKKKLIENYADYTFKFISIAKEVQNLKTQTYNNPYSITFNPINDITSLLNTIMSADIDKQKQIYQFIKKELGNEVDIVKLDSNLATVINLLAKEKWDDANISDNPNAFEIGKKISHNIRYKNLSIENTLKTLDRYTSDAEYETLYLFLSGCDFTQGNQKQVVLQKIKQEDTFKKRLEKHQTKSAYEVALSLINNQIEKLDKKKSNLNINEYFEKDLERLNKLKYNINFLSSEISKLSVRKDLIEETENDLLASKSTINLQQLEMIYKQAKQNIPSLQKSFEDMVNYHNRMLKEKSEYITKELPNLIENIITQLNEVEENLKIFNDELGEIDTELFSDDFETTVKEQLNKFNKHFTYTSLRLYNEQYALKYDIVKNKKNQQLYKFSAFNTNFSSGKKQGEISCFDIAYISFADEENIPCMHFLLNDKKELMYDNQLVEIANLVNENNIQFVASILSDKLPQELNKEEYIVVKLSEDDKLFKIEANLPK